MSRIFKLSTPKRNTSLRNEERLFEKEAKKLEDLEDTCRKLYKDAKKCSDSAAALCKCERRITQDLLASSMCQSEEPLLKHCEEWDSSIVKLDLHMQEMNSNIQKTLVEPVKKFNLIFPSLHTAKKKREQSLEEYEKWETKVKKYQERDRTGNNIVKLHQSQKSLIPAKEEFYEQHYILMEDMPKLYDCRTDYFQPCLEALIKSQVLRSASLLFAQKNKCTHVIIEESRKNVTYNSEAYKIYSELAGQLIQENRTAEDYAGLIQQKLQDIKGLSIVD